MKVCIVGGSGKPGQYLVQHALDRGYEVVAVWRERSVEKLDAFKGRSKIIPGATNDREAIEKAVSGCNGVLTVLPPGVSTTNPRELPRRCSTMHLRVRASCSRADGTSPATIRMSTRACLK